MAFICVLYLKEECDGCGACEKRRGMWLNDDGEDGLMDAES